MRVLLVGANGMLGHKAMQVLGERFEVAGTIRGKKDDYRGLSLLEGHTFFEGVQATEQASYVAVLEEFKPEAVLNCIGVVKQRPHGSDPEVAIAINALFPHQLAAACSSRGIRMIQVSTDCVFSGKRGAYKEGDVADAEDLYGRSKLLGELGESEHLTLRASMIGRELSERRGLLEWFLSQRGGSVKGFANAVFTGFTTIALAGIIAELLDNHKGLKGLWHVSSESISKFDLLQRINALFGTEVEIVRDEDFFCDRSLDGSRFLKETGIAAPSWDAMLQELYDDPTSY